VVEGLKGALTLDGELELLVGARVLDGDADRVLVRVPEKADADAIGFTEVRSAA
jgi:hypothetical protein